VVEDGQAEIEEPGVNIFDCGHDGEQAPIWQGLPTRNGA
jgi:hypothetical protein